MLTPQRKDAATEATAGIFNRAWFWWFSPLLLAGYNKTLAVTDLFVVDDDIGLTSKEHDLPFKFANGKILKKCPRHLLNSVLIPHQQPICKNHMHYLESS